MANSEWRIEGEYVRAYYSLFATRLLLLQPHFFQRRRPRIGIDQHQGGLGDARADAARPAVLPDRAQADAFVHEPLDLVQDRLALRAIGFARLLRVEFVDIGIATVGVGAGRGHDLGDARGRIAVHRR